MASINAIKSAIITNTFDSAAAALYGDFSDFSHRSRYLNLLDKHILNFGASDAVFFSSPGRIEVAGNHTDHNNGKVVAAAVTIDTLAAVTPRSGNKIRVMSEGFKPVEVDLNNLNAEEGEKFSSKALVKGVAAYFMKNGLKTGGFDATVTSKVFKGAGVSSSSSFEVLIAEIFNYFFNNSEVGNVEKALASKFAENEYFGKPSGLMDQASIALGGINLIDFESVERPAFRRLNWQFWGLDIFVVNTGGDHSGLTAEYSAIKSEMNAVAAHFGKNVLREVKMDEFVKSMPELVKKCSGRAVLRALHYFEENLRVDAIAAALDSINQDAFLKLINESGDSSAKLLQNLHAESDTLQPVALGIELSRRFEGVKAVRVHGGGFAGTILVFVEKRTSNAYFKYIKSLFGEKNTFKLAIREPGATIVPLWR
ncbi:MAG: galactokinase [Christensenellales bacterium]|jgi:galactokinase